MPLINLLLIIFTHIWASEIPFTIYHTNDLHSHFDGVKIAGEKKIGGYDRIASSIEKLRSENIKRDEIIFGVDAGDFFSGTIFSGIALSKSPSFPEYEFFTSNHYDAVALGNHEFDATNPGLEIMFNKIKGDSILLATNAYLKTAHSSLVKFFGDEKIVKRFIIKEYNAKNNKEKLRVAFLGVLGPDGCHVSKGLRADVGLVGYHDLKSKEDLSALADYLNNLTRELRAKNHVQVVVLSMHGGGSEAQNLAKKLEGVNIIIAGHTHEVEFKIVNNIIISQTGSYGANLGVLNLNYNDQTNEVHLLDFKKESLIAMDDKIKGSEKWQKIIKNWKNESLQIMGDAKLKTEEVIYTPNQDYIMSGDAFNPYGTFLTTKIKNQLNIENKDNVDIYFTVSGLIRSPLMKGVHYTRPDIFDIFSVGFDQNLVPGVDVVTFYLSVHEVKLIMNFLEIYSKLTRHYSPVFSDNLTFKYNKYGIPFFNRLQDVKLDGVPLTQYSRLIKLSTNRYIIDNLATIENVSKGLIKIDPKDKDGNSIRKYPAFSKEDKLQTNYFLSLKH